MGNEEQIRESGVRDGVRDVGEGRRNVNLLCERRKEKLEIIWGNKSDVNSERHK